MTSLSEEQIVLFNVLVFLLLLDPHQKEEVNKKAFEKFKKEHSAVPPTVDNAMPSERFEGKASLQNRAVARVCEITASEIFLVQI